MRKRTKFFLLRSSILLLFAVLAGRIWYVQVVMSSYYKAQADTSKIRVVPSEAPRGIIYDSSGKQLVYNIPDWSIEIVPHGVPKKHPLGMYRTLSKLLGGKPSAADIAWIVYSNRFRPYAPAIVKQHVAFQTAIIIRQLHTQLPGVRTDSTSIRQYVTEPQFSLSHMLGYTGDIDQATYQLYHRKYPYEHVDATDQTGMAGLEGVLDPYLHGVNGREHVEVDAGERPVRVLRPGAIIPGDSVYLTINWKLQQQVASDLAAALQHLQLHQGVAVLEDVNTGRIVSMVSLPGYDNNPLAGPHRGKAFVSLIKNPYHPLVDLATGGEFPPGSTYKVITATAGLQTGVVDSTTTINDGGELKPCPQCQVFHGWQPPPGLGPMNVVTALSHSSDIYFYSVAGGNPSYPNLRHIGGARLAKWAELFGLGRPTGIGLPGEAAGFVPTPSWFNHLKPGPLKNPTDSWTVGYDYNSAIGQGFDLATPLQMANVTATIADNGVLHQPSLIRQIVGRVVPGRGILRHSRVIKNFTPKVIRKNFISPTTLALVQLGMHQSVTNCITCGTSFNVFDPRIDAAGKTGTAEDPPHAPHAWWIGYAPYNHPKVAIVVMVPNANGEGAYVAAPIAHKLLEDYFHLPASPNWLNKVTQTLVGGAGGNQ